MNFGGQIPMNSDEFWGQIAVISMSIVLILQCPYNLHRKILGHLFLTLEPMR